MGNVLFVDDEPLILRSIQRSMIGEGINTFYAESAQEALKILTSEHIDVLVTDMRMPQTNGLDLLKKVKSAYPQVVKIVLSGYTQTPQVVATINQGEVFRFITKPWDFENDLMPAIREALDHVAATSAKTQEMMSITARNEVYQKMFNHFQNHKNLLEYNINTLIKMNSELSNQLLVIDDGATSNQFTNALTYHFNQLKAHMPYELHALTHEKIMQQIAFFIQDTSLFQVTHFKLERAQLPIVFGIPWLLGTVSSSLIDCITKDNPCFSINIEISSNIESDYECTNELFLSCLLDFSFEKKPNDNEQNNWIDYIKELHKEVIDISYAYTNERIIVQLKQLLHRRK